MQPLVALGYPGEPMTPEAVEAALGDSLEDLALAWRAWALERFEAVDGHDQQARRYLEETPIRYFGVCRPGVESREHGGDPLRR